MLAFGIVMGTAPISVLGTNIGPSSLTVFKSVYVIPRELWLLLGPVGVAMAIAGWLATIDRPTRIGVAMAFVCLLAGVFAWLSGGGEGLGVASLIMLILLTWNGLRSPKHAWDGDPHPTTWAN